jgi:hypothetical protein
MNQSDKKTLKKSYEEIKGLQTLMTELIKEVKERKLLTDVLEALRKIEPEVEEIKESEEEKYESRSQRWKETYNGEMLKEQVDSLESALDGIQTAISYLEYTFE